MSFDATPKRFLKFQTNIKKKNRGNLGGEDSCSTISFTGLQTNGSGGGGGAA
jgi:hypothetical protein